jgi:hypothetical protein
MAVVDETADKEQSADNVDRNSRQATLGVIFAKDIGGWSQCSPLAYGAYFSELKEVILIK